MRLDWMDIAFRWCSPRSTTDGDCSLRLALLENSEMASTVSLGTSDVDLVPRFSNQGYDVESVALRREWLQSKTGSNLKHVGAFSISSSEMKGNIENPVGAAQIPL